MFKSDDDGWSLAEYENNSIVPGKTKHEVLMEKWNAAPPTTFENKVTMTRKEYDRLILQPGGVKIVTEFFNRNGKITDGD